MLKSIKIAGFKKEYVFPMLLILFYVSEAINKIALTIYHEKIFFSGSIKFICYAIILGCIIKLRKWRILLLPSILFLLFLISQYVLFGLAINKEAFFVFSKYLFLIFLLEIAFIHFKAANNELFFKTFESILFINSILILVGVLFKIELFSTYSLHRFGFNGLIPTSSSTTYIYTITLFYYLTQNSTNNYKKYTILLSALFIGTKSVYLFLFIFIMYLCIKRINKKYKFYILTAGVSIIGVVSYFYLTINPIFSKIIEERGILSAIFSHRDKLLLERTIPFIEEKWSLVHYFIGGFDRLKTFSQLGFIDLFVFFGIISVPIYLFAFYRSLIKVRLTKEHYFTLALICLIIFSSGNFFYNTSLAIYLVLLQQIFMKQVKS